MKSLFKSISLLFSFFIFSKALIAQCATVSGSAFPRWPQTGSHNYFGVMVSMGSTYNEDVVVTGYIHPDVDPNTHMVPFELTITVGNTSASTGDDYFETDPTGGADITITSVSPCPPGLISPAYTGVRVTTLNLLEVGDEKYSSTTVFLWQSIMESPMAPDRKQLKYVRH